MAKEEAEAYYASMIVWLDETGDWSGMYEYAKKQLNSLTYRFVGTSELDKLIKYEDRHSRKNIKDALEIIEHYYK